MSDPLKELSDAFRSEFLALSFLGALIALSFWPVADRRRAAINVAVGTVISGASAPAILALISWFWPTLPISSPIVGAVYFWIGLLGMHIVPIVIAILNRYKTANPPGVE